MLLLSLNLTLGCDIDRRMGERLNSFPWCLIYSTAAAASAAAFAATSASSVGLSSSLLAKLTSVNSSFVILFFTCSCLTLSFPLLQSLLRMLSWIAANFPSLNNLSSYFFAARWESRNTSFNPSCPIFASNTCFFILYTKVSASSTKQE